MPVPRPPIHILFNFGIVVSQLLRGKNDNPVMKFLRSSNAEKCESSDYCFNVGVSVGYTEPYNAMATDSIPETSSFGIMQRFLKVAPI